MLPNFFVIGAAKAATFSLYEYLKQHPSIFMSALKEPRYFSYDSTDPDQLPGKSSPLRVKTRAEYEALFDDVREETAIGEASPGYLTNELACRRLHEAVPKARLIAVLRNPVDRAYSDYLMSVRAGKETRPVEEALTPGELWVERGKYAEGVRRYMDLFGRDNLHVLLFENLATDTLNTVQEIFSFLGVDDSFTPAVSVTHNPGGVIKSRSFKYLYGILKNNQKLVARIRGILPDPIRDYWRALKKSKMTKPPPLKNSVRESLEIYYRDDIQGLESLLGVDLSDWYRCGKDEITK